MGDPHRPAIDRLDGHDRACAIARGGVRRSTVAEIDTERTIRDLKAFTSLIGDEAVFFGAKGAMRGRADVVEGWKRFFDGAAAPFSWQPSEVEVLDSGTLGMTSGPVLDPQGRRIGTFNSIWQRQKDGSWRVIFDKGCPPCDCK